MNAHLCVINAKAKGRPILPKEVARWDGHSSLSRVRTKNKASADAWRWTLTHFFLTGQKSARFVSLTTCHDFLVNLVWSISITSTKSFKTLLFGSMFRSSALSSSAVAGGVTAAAATEGAVCSDVATSTKGWKATSSDGSPPLQVRD